MYLPAEAAAKLPPVGQVGTAAKITELQKMPNGSYLLEIVPANRFFVVEYVIEDEQIPTARVEYYSDLPEDEKLIKELEIEFKNFLIRMGDVAQSKTFENVMYENDRTTLNFYCYVIISNHRELDEREKLYFLWSRYLSERLEFAIYCLENTIPGAERARKRTPQFKNN